MVRKAGEKGRSQRAPVVRARAHAVPNRPPTTRLFVDGSRSVRMVGVRPRYGVTVAETSV